VKTKPFRFRGRFNRRGRNTRKMFFRLFRRIGAVAAVEKLGRVKLAFRGFIDYW